MSFCWKSTQLSNGDLQSSIWSHQYSVYRPRLSYSTLRTKLFKPHHWCPVARLKLGDQTSNIRPWHAPYILSTKSKLIWFPANWLHLTSKIKIWAADHKCRSTRQSARQRWPPAYPPVKSIIIYRKIHWLLSLNQNFAGSSDYVDPPIRCKNYLKISEMTTWKISSGYGVDSCSAPNYAYTLNRLG